MSVKSIIFDDVAFDTFISKIESKKLSPPENPTSDFRGRELWLRVTTPNLPKPHGAGLIKYGREMIRRYSIAFTGDPVTA
jgi:hypothetical protein